LGSKRAIFPRSYETHSPFQTRARTSAGGATQAEVQEAIRKGSREPATRGREMCRYNFVFNRKWQGKHYPIKQVAPVIKEEANETVVITVYTFYF
jgi:hypothetical protein